MCRKGRFHSVSAGLTRMPALKTNTLRIRSSKLLMRNPGLIIRMFMIAFNHVGFIVVAFKFRSEIMQNFYNWS